MKTLLHLPAMPPHNSRASKEIALYLFVLVVAQPVLDMLSYFLRAINTEMVITLLRGGLAGFGVLMGIRHRVLKALDFAYAGLLLLFAAVSFYLKSQSMGHFDPMLELVTFAKLYSFPAMFLIVLRLIAYDKEALLSQLVQAAFVSICLIVVSVALSLVTGTYNFTYDQEWAQIGVTGWFYSGNQQSLVLIALLPVLLAVSFRYGNLLAGLVATGAAAYLLLFNGTRVAWLGWLGMSALFLYLLVFELRRHNLKSRYTVYFLVILAGLAAAVLFIASLPMSTISSGRQFHLNRMLETVQAEAAAKHALPEAVAEPDLLEVAAEPDLLEVMPEVLVKEEAEPARPVLDEPVSEAPADGELPPLSPRETPPLDQVRWGALTREEASNFERNLTRTGFSEMELAVTVAFSRAMESSSARQRVDERYRQRVFTTLVRAHANPMQRLTGVAHQLISEYVGDLETDYTLVYSAYGLLGSLLFYAIFLVEIIRVLPAFKRARLSWLTLPQLLIPAFIMAMLFGAAYFAGRTFKQPAVSIYLALAIAYLLNMLHHLGKGNMQPESVG